MPVAPICKEVRVAAMPDDVIHDGCRLTAVGRCAGRMFDEELKASLAPPRRVASTAGRAGFVETNAALTLGSALAGAQRPVRHENVTRADARRLHSVPPAIDAFSD